METGTDGDIVTVTFVVVLVAITQAGKELLVVRVFKTGTPTNLVELLGCTARSVSKRHEPASGRVDARIPCAQRLAFQRVAILVNCKLRFAARNQHLVGLQVECQRVVFVERQFIAGTYVHAGRDKVAAVVGVFHLTTEVLEAETYIQITCSHRQLQGLTVEDRHISSCRYGRVHVLVITRRRVLALTIVQVGVEQTNSHTHRYILVQFAEITEVQRPLIRPNCTQIGIALRRKRYVTHREIREARTDTSGQLTEVIETGEVSQIDVTHQFAQPRRVVSGDTTLRVHVRVLGRVPVLCVKIGIRGHTYVTQTCCTGIRRNRKGRHRCDQRIHRVIDWRLCIHHRRAQHASERNKNFFHLF